MMFKTAYALLALVLALIPASARCACMSSDSFCAEMTTHAEMNSGLGADTTMKHNGNCASCHPSLAVMPSKDVPTAALTLSRVDMAPPVEMPSAPFAELATIRPNPPPIPSPVRLHIRLLR